MNNPTPPDQYDPFSFREPPKLLVQVSKRNFLTLHQLSFWQRVRIAFGLALHGTARLPDQEHR